MLALDVGNSQEWKGTLSNDKVLPVNTQISLSKDMCMLFKAYPTMLGEIMADL